MVHTGSQKRLTPKAYMTAPRATKTSMYIRSCPCPSLMPKAKRHSEAGTQKRTSHSAVSQNEADRRRKAFRKS